MRTNGARTLMMLAVAMLLIVPTTTSAQQAPVAALRPTSQELLQTPAAEWLHNGGSLNNQAFSTLDQITKENVQNLGGAWMARLNGSGYAAKYALEVRPLVMNGVMYVTTGNDDVFALSAKTGEFMWEYHSELEQNISTVCCGWDNRGPALGEGMVFVGRLDSRLMALDQETGKLRWIVDVPEGWQNGYTITMAPTYYDGLVFVGVSGGEYGIRGRLYAFEAQTGREAWRFYTTAAPGEPNGGTWEGDSWMRGGASIWNTPAVDPELGMLYFATGNCAPDYDGSSREGMNLYCASVVALDYRTGQYRWHFQQVHHDIWDYDAASNVILFDQMYNGQMRRGLAQAGRTGMIYMLDRATGEPLVGIEERPVPEDPRQKTYPTQPYVVGDTLAPLCPAEEDRLPGWPWGCIFTPFWDVATIVQPSGIGGVNWAPMSYSPLTGHFYAGALIKNSGYVARSQAYEAGKTYTAGTQSTPIGSRIRGTLSAMDSRTNTLVWQKEVPFSAGHGSGGGVVTQSGLWFRGNGDGTFVALDVATGNELWSFQTGFGADAPPSTYMVDGEQYVVIATGGNPAVGSARGDAIWAFKLGGQVHPLYPPPPPISEQRWPTTGVLETNGVNITDYDYVPSTYTGSAALVRGQIRVAVGTTVTWTNRGDVPHTATDQGGTWSTGLIDPGQTGSVTFNAPGDYTYYCEPHPWMIGRVIVE